MFVSCFLCAVVVATSATSLSLIQEKSYQVCEVNCVQTINLNNDAAKTPFRLFRNRKRRVCQSLNIEVHAIYSKSHYLQTVILLTSSGTNSVLMCAHACHFQQTYTINIKNELNQTLQNFSTRRS
jgi:hypothetical protein